MELLDQLILRRWEFHLERDIHKFRVVQGESIYQASGITPFGHDLRADLMQAGGDVLGRCFTAKHVALEHLGQLITSYVGKVPSTVPPNAPHTDADDGLGVQQCLALWLH